MGYAESFNNVRNKPKLTVIVTWSKVTTKEYEPENRLKHQLYMRVVGYDRKTKLLSLTPYGIEDPNADLALCEYNEDITGNGFIHWKNCKIRISGLYQLIRSCDCE